MYRAWAGQKNWALFLALMLICFMTLSRLWHFPFFVHLIHQSRKFMSFICPALTFVGLSLQWIPQGLILNSMSLVSSH